MMKFEDDLHRLRPSNFYPPEGFYSTGSYDRFWSENEWFVLNSGCRRCSSECRRYLERYFMLQALTDLGSAHFIIIADSLDAKNGWLIYQLIAMILFGLRMKNFFSGGSCFG